MANLAGMLVFLAWSASCCWIEPELKDVPVATGGVAFVWAFGPLPVLAAFVLADLVWAAVAGSKGLRERRWTFLVTPFLMLVSWAAVFIFDGWHHGN